MKLQLTAFQVFCLIIGGRLCFSINPCTEYTALAQHNTQVIYVAYYYACGFLNWGSCYGTYSYTGYYSTYIASLECCTGYSGVYCLPYCSYDCEVNKECSLPDTCTCIEGWKGDDCLTDINECDDALDLCEYHDTCNNTEGSYICGCEETKILATDGLRCLDAVTNLRVTPGSRSFEVNFDLPSDYANDGVFGGIYVSCLSESYADNNTFWGQLESINFTGLFPFSHYSCCVIPQWVTSGNGPPVCFEEYTLQHSPDDPPSNITVEAASERSILIEWKPPAVPNGIIENYKLYINYTNGSAVHNIYVASLYNFYLLEGLHAHQEVGISVGAISGGGEGPKTEYIFATTFEDEPGQVHDLQVILLTAYAVNITWYPPKVLNGIIIKYYLNVTTETKSNENVYYKELNPNETLFIQLQHLQPFIPYTVMVAASTVIGWGEVSPITFFTQQTTPATFPNITKVDRILPSSITIYWDALTLEQLRGNLAAYQVTISESIYQCDATARSLQINTTNHWITQFIFPLKTYCISVVAITLGFGVSSEPWYLQAHESSIFELHLTGLGSCRIWLDSNSEHKVEAMVENLVQVLNSYCLCNLQTFYLGDTHFVCDDRDESRAIFQGRIAGTSTTQSPDLIIYLQRWVNTAPTIVVQGLLLYVDDECEVALDDFGTNTSCIVTSSPTSTVETRDTNHGSDLNTAAAIAVSIIAILIILAGILIATFIVIYVFKPKKISNLKFPQESALIPKQGTINRIYGDFDGENEGSFNSYDIVY